jgi:fatty-acyl-CoA synthase
LAALVNEEGVTMAAGVPTVWLNLLAHLRESW